jgi:hypothetical protein
MIPVAEPREPSGFVKMEATGSERMLRMGSSLVLRCWQALFRTGGVDLARNGTQLRSRLSGQPVDGQMMS